MNKNIEIQKIKVNNGQELIAEAKKWKNSGGEWKLLERYWTLPARGKEKGWSKKNNSGGFIISNGEQKVDIFLEGHREVLDLLLTDDWDQMKAIFPEISRTCGNDSVPFRIPGKEVKKGEEKVFLGRMLNAWSIADIFKIIVDYRKENETEIKKSVASLGFETSLKHWIKVGNDTDGNIFIWLGKRDEENIDVDGGGELQIAINRKDLARCSTSHSHFENPNKKTVFWKDLDNRQLANELLEMRINPFWHLISSGGKKGAISACDNHQVGFTPTPDSNSDLPDKETYSPKKDNSQKNKTNPLTDTEKQQILQYFLKNGIKKISLKEGQLIITHNNNNTIITSENSEQKEYHRIIEKLPTQSLSLSELQNNNTNSNSNKDDKSFYKGLVIGAVVIILIGLIAYCWKRKNRSTFSRNPKR
ncbi:MAG: hypothetical protein MRERV_14c031 [Mycoplasmataceae bacterium RV_VA103A]|nr:MAG: hypothetical protein MRERV_14c031 [Mycoplasmataceae bacterium RV_VA103A]